jgi:hypothetical protein
MKIRSRLISAVALAYLTVAPALAAGPYTVVSEGLNNPRGLAFGTEGQLYVSQVGTGGTTGKITQIRDPESAHPHAQDLVTGLISIPDGGGGFAGVAGLSVAADGTLYAIMQTIYTNPPTPPQLQGHLVKVNHGGKVGDVANVADFDFAWFAAHGTLGFPSDHPDANPYDVLVLPNAMHMNDRARQDADDDCSDTRDGRGPAGPRGVCGTYVVDAATNTLDLVHTNGAKDVLAYFPDNAFADATPTCVAQGPDGALYIGTLAMVDSIFAPPTPIPAAIVYRVDPKAAKPGSLPTVLSLAKPWASGLWPINGCAFGPDGNFYVSELGNNFDPTYGGGVGIFTGGDVVKIPFATPGVHLSLTGNALTMPAGVAVDGNGDVYVANGTAFVPNGQVVRLTHH